ncbi:MAG: hypothetical protein AAF202_01680 [Pseudomonadota bacterium]
MNDDEIWNLCKLTLALVFILGAGVYATNGRPPGEFEAQSEIQSMRTPASLLSSGPRALSNVEQLTPSISTVNLECLGSEKIIRLNSESQQMRLIGRNCSQNEGQLVIKNITNGFEASVFQRPQLKFSSDYVTLNRGTNAIHISYRKEGEDVKVAELVVTRMQ